MKIMTKHRAIYALLIIHLIISFSYTCSAQESHELDQDSLLSYFPFDESDGMIYDQMNTSRNAPIKQGQLVTGVIGDALSISSRTETIDIAVDGSYGMTHNFSLMFWMKPQESSWRYPLLFSGRDIVCYTMLIEGGYYHEQHISFQYITDTSKIIWIESNRRIQENQWYHIAIIKEQDEILLCINGLVDNSKIFENSGNISSFGRSLSLGKINDNINHYFNGIIDEVYLFTKPLPISEIYEYYSHIKENLSSNPDDQIDQGNQTDPNGYTPGFPFALFIGGLMLLLFLRKSKKGMQ